ncbi:Syntaxin-51 [Camellia lanceoleosa]|uniref:Syntaxin-51 n=1 Tax=Camellia lanceoleosa TaxID=1840588 RepID=A0ACC0G718_9ERIC|nr:Syntaxin-51 [Camellia lanceoleosa]
MVMRFPNRDSLLGPEIEPADAISRASGLDNYGVVGLQRQIMEVKYLANQEWVKSDSLKIVENTAVPIIMLLVEVPHDLITPAVSTISTLKEEPTEVISGDNPFQTNMANLESSASPKCSNMNTDDGKDMKSIRLDISFLLPSHTGLQTTELVKEFTERLPAATPLALVVVEEVKEGLGDVGGVDELEDEASAADAELKSGGGVIVETVVGSPLDVEADDEAVESGTMDGCDSKI